MRPQFPVSGENPFPKERYHSVDSKARECEVLKSYREDLLDIRWIYSVDCRIMHMLSGKCCSVKLEAFMCAFKIAEVFGVLKSLPYEIQGEEGIFQWNSASWLFAAICVSECSSVLVERPATDKVPDKESK